MGRYIAGGGAAVVGGLAVAGGVVAGGLFLAGGIYATLVATPELIDNLQSVVEENADATHDDEGSEEGGAPPDSSPDGGVCDDPKTIPNAPPTIPDDPKAYRPEDAENDVRENNDTELPVRPYRDPDRTFFPEAGDPYNPTIPKAPKLPYPIFE
jgi:hypothetical protein